VREEMKLVEANCVSKNGRDDVGWAMVPHDCTATSSSSRARDNCRRAGGHLRRQEAYLCAQAKVSTQRWRACWRARQAVTARVPRARERSSQRASLAACHRSGHTPKARGQRTVPKAYLGTTHQTCAFYQPAGRPSQVVGWPSSSSSRTPDPRAETPAACVNAPPVATFGLHVAHRRAYTELSPPLAHFLLAHLSGTPRTSDGPRSSSSSPSLPFPPRPATWAHTRLAKQAPVLA